LAYGPLIFWDTFTILKQIPAQSLQIFLISEKKSDAPKTKNILGYSRVILGFFSVSRILGVLIFRVFFSKKNIRNHLQPKYFFFFMWFGGIFAKQWHPYHNSTPDEP